MEKEITNERIDPKDLFSLSLRERIAFFQENSAHFRAEQVEGSFLIDIFTGKETEGDDYETFIYESGDEWENDVSILRGEKFFVDIPTEACIANPEGAWKNVATFSTHKAALDFVKEHFNTDDKGRVCLISN